MKLSPKIIENIYSMLYCVEPFASWDLPLPEEIKFIVDSDPDAMGTYLYDDGETMIDLAARLEERNNDVARLSEALEGARMALGEVE